MGEEKEISEFERKELEQLRKEKLDNLQKDVNILKKLFSAHEQALSTLIDKIDEITEKEEDKKIEGAIDKEIKKKQDQNKMDNMFV